MRLIPFRVGRIERDYRLSVAMPQHSSRISAGQFALRPALWDGWPNENNRTLKNRIAGVCQRERRCGQFVEGEQARSLSLFPVQVSAKGGEIGRASCRERVEIS